MNLNNLSGVTDGAPAMVGTDKGLVTRKEAGVFKNG
jgi:hypothetical protein